MSESSYKNRCFINPSIGAYYLVIIYAKLYRIEEIGMILYWYLGNESNVIKELFDTWFTCDGTV